jgi:protein-L-isoaspartate(D-aspartate) O-methyltransferase
MRCLVSLLAVLPIISACGCDSQAPPTATQATAGKVSATPASQPTTRPLEWTRPRFEELAAARKHMVESQMAPFGAPAVTDEKVLAAMREVPRHEFVPVNVRGRAYADTALPIGQGQTISQPYIVAMMTEVLKVRPGHRVLEIGTGSGYQAAVLSELTPHVYTIEIVDSLGKEAAGRLDRLGYKTVKTKVADGYHGWKDQAPFDVIIVTCAATHIPDPLYQQLKSGGVMCIPVGSAWGDQQLILVEKGPDGQPKTISLLGVRFVPLTGGHD